MSASGYSTVSHCEMAWFIGSVLKWRLPSPWKATDIGTITHSVLELLANAKLTKQGGKARFDDPVIGVVTFSKLFEADYLEKIIEKIYYDHCTKSTHHDWDASDLKKVKKYIKTLMEHQNGAYNPLLQEIVGAEIEFNPTIDEPWAKYSYEFDGKKIEGNLALRGFIDIVTKVDSDTIEICDYKTGQRKDFHSGKVKDYDALFNDIQLRMYYYAATLLYPTIPNVLVTIYYIKDGGPFTISYGPEDIPETLRMIQEKFEKVRDKIKPDKNTGFHCRKFCEFGLNTFEGTNVPVLKSATNTHCGKKGEPHKICSQVEYIMEHRTMDSVIKNMSKPSSTLLKLEETPE